MARVNIPNGVREEAKHTYITVYNSSGWNGLTNTSYNNAVVNGDVLKSAFEKILLKANNKIYTFSESEYKENEKMTSNNSPVLYVVSASSVYDTSTYVPWKAFNGTNKDPSDCWITKNNERTGWIQLYLGEAKVVNKVSVTSRNYSDAPTNAPKDFEILGSDDGIIFDTLLKVTNQTEWKLNETREFRLDKLGDYKYYRMNISANNGSVYVAIGEIKFSFKPTLIELPQHTIQNFKNYGSSSEINGFNEIYMTKRYILQDDASEDVNGLWTQELNRKPLSIKFE